MVAKIDFDTLKMYQQMRLKIANQKKATLNSKFICSYKKESVLP